jgi:hypothetical protein
VLHVIIKNKYVNNKIFLIHLTIIIDILMYKPLCKNQVVYGIKCKKYQQVEHWKCLVKFLRIKIFKGWELENKLLIKLLMFMLSKLFCKINKNRDKKKKISKNKNKRIKKLC